MSPRVAPPNYTQAPNLLFDELLRDKLKPLTLAELKVLLVVVRHTIGYHAEESKLSLSDLETRCGLSRRSTIDGIRACLERGTIERRVEGDPGAQRSFYALSLAGEATAPGLVKNLHQAQESICTSSGEGSAPPHIEKETSKENPPQSPPKGALGEIWERVLEDLEGDVAPMTLTAFRDSLSIAYREGNHIVLQASDDTVAGWARTSFLAVIEGAVTTVLRDATATVELPRSETEVKRDEIEELRRHKQMGKGKRGFRS